MGGIRPRKKLVKRSRFQRCPKCGKQIRIHQVRCKVCSQRLKVG